MNNRLTRYIKEVKEGNYMASGKVMQAIHRAFEGSILQDNLNTLKGSKLENLISFKGTKLSQDELDIIATQEEENIYSVMEDIDTLEFLGFVNKIRQRYGSNGSFSKLGIKITKVDFAEEYARQYFNYEGIKIGKDRKELRDQLARRATYQIVIDHRHERQMLQREQKETDLEYHSSPSLRHA